MLLYEMNLLGIGMQLKFRSRLVLVLFGRLRNLLALFGLFLSFYFGVLRFFFAPSVLFWHFSSFSTFLFIKRRSFGQFSNFHSFSAVLDFIHTLTVSDLAFLISSYFLSLFLTLYIVQLSNINRIEHNKIPVCLIWHLPP